MKEEERSVENDFMLQYRMYRSKAYALDLFTRMLDDRIESLEEDDSDNSNPLHFKNERLAEAKSLQNTLSLLKLETIDV